MENNVARFRAILDCTQEELSNRSGVSIPAIIDIEKEVSNPWNTTKEKIAMAFEDMRLEFIDGCPGMNEICIKHIDLTKPIARSDVFPAEVNV